MQNYFVRILGYSCAHLISHPLINLIVEIYSPITSVISCLIYFPVLTYVWGSFRYVSIGDIARVGIHPPNVAAIYRHIHGQFSLPVGYDLVSNMTIPRTLFIL